MSLILPLLAGAALMTAIVALRYFAVSGTMAALTLCLHPIAGPAPARRRAQVQREIAWSLLAALIYGIPAGIVGALWQRGGTAIYAGNPHGIVAWLALPASALAYLFAHDTWFYWTHRWMHRPAVFARVHAVHHASKPPTAWAAMSFHWTESLSGAVVVPLLALVVPIHVAALLTVLTVMTWNGVINHMGWEIYPRRWVAGWFGRAVITPSHHHLHHRDYRCNYGLYFRFWDRVGGTDRGWARELLADRVAEPAA